MWDRGHTLWDAASIRRCCENRDSGLLEGSLHPVRTSSLSMGCTQHLTRHTFFMSGQAMAVYFTSFGSRRLARSLKWAKGQTDQS